MARGIADPERVVIGGWSWGGYITLLALGLLATAEVFADNTASTLTPMLVNGLAGIVAGAVVYAGIALIRRMRAPAASPAH